MKALPIINAAGCLILIAFIITQWTTNQEQEKALRASRLAERNTLNGKIEAENRATQLQADIDNLKATLDLMRKEADEAKVKITDGEVLAQQLQTGLVFNAAHFDALNQGIADRDARITELTSSLVATRKRLDEAIEKLKQAAKQP